MPFGGWGFLLVCLWAKMAAASPPALGTIGEVCSLYEPAPHAGVICQATGEWVVDDAVVLNARKGDLLLNSACGPTARLVDTAVAQKYSHVGIMIEDRSRVRHARVHLKPFEDSIEANGGSGSRLKFGWPGVVSQTVQAAYEGSELRPKPPAAPAWTPDFIQLDSHFGSDPDPDPECEDMMLLPPRVIRPPLEFEDQIFAEDGLSVRERLFAVADESIGLTGHYRFYAFTETDIHGRTSGPGADGPETGLETFWEDEVGERHHPKGMQCAAFVWQSTQAAGFSVDDGLPHPVHTDPAVWVYDGDELEHGPADSRGLYVYPEEKRHQGISFLGAVVRKKVADMIALWPGSFLAEAVGVPEKLSRQMRACFAFDECDYQPWVPIPSPSPSGGSVLVLPDDYQRLYAGEVGDGLAFSPGDLTHWDAYPHGLWGSTTASTKCGRSPLSWARLTKAAVRGAAICRSRWNAEMARASGFRVFNCGSPSQS